MADRLDDLLTLLGQEANETIDFDGAFAQVLAKAKAQEQGPLAEAPARKPDAGKPRRRPAWRGALSMAAAVVVLLGAAVLIRQTGLLNGAGSTPPAGAPSEAHAAEDAAAPQAAAEAAPEAAMAPFAAAPASEPAAEPGAGAPRLASAQTEGSPFYGQGALLAPALQEDGAADTGAGSKQAPLEVLGDICMLGTAPAKDALQALQDAGYTASLGGDGYVDQGRALESGEACIAPEGQVGVWNTGDGYITLTGPGMTQTEIYDAFISAL